MSGPVSVVLTGAGAMGSTAARNGCSGVATGAGEGFGARGWIDSTRVRLTGRCNRPPDDAVAIGIAAALSMLALLIASPSGAEFAGSAAEVGVAKGIATRRCGTPLHGDLLGPPAPIGWLLCSPTVTTGTNSVRVAVQVRRAGADEDPSPRGSAAEYPGGRFNDGGEVSDSGAGA